MIYLAIPIVIAAAVIAAAWLDWHGTLGPAWWLALPVRLVAPHTGHHRDKYATETPAPSMAVQARRSGDPHAPTCAVRGAATIPALRGAARAGQAQDPAANAPQPDAAPEPVPPGDDGAAAAPAPNGPPSIPRGPGQHAFRPVIMQFPGGEVGILGADGRWHIKPLAWQPGIRETGAQPALVRGGRVAFEAWQDKAVNVP